MFLIPISKHDRYLNRLFEEISPYYDSLSKNVKITKKGRSVAEIDILAKKRDYYDIYEVKCSYRITKARKQKKKFLKHSNLKIRRIFFYCGATASLIVL